MYAEWIRDDPSNARRAFLYRRRYGCKNQIRDETHKGKGNLCSTVTRIQIILSQYTSRRYKLEYIHHDMIAWRFLTMKHAVNVTKRKISY